jgi:NAD+ synthase (glutamine-hydrolysing)
MLDPSPWVRVAAVVPVVRVADCPHNAERVLDLMARAGRDGAEVLVFPELCLTGYTCADLFAQRALQDAARAALRRVAAEGAGLFGGLAAVGLPLLVDGMLFNVAAVLHRGRVLGLVPKSYLPNGGEFYEGRWFAPAERARGRTADLDGTAVPFGTDLVFACADRPGLTVGVEVCEDLWVPAPPSSFQALAGATLLVNLSASNETIGKAEYRRGLVAGQSARCLAGYVYASCGVHESTTDVVFGGHCLIAENGTVLAEAPRFDRGEPLILADVDVEHLLGDRSRCTSFATAGTQLAGRPPFVRVPFAVGPRTAAGLRRPVDAHPFVPRGQERLRERCEEIFHIQTSALATRLEKLPPGLPLTLGLSGGLDSTLALLVACRTLDLLGRPRAALRALTMPGYGTTARTRSNATALMGLLGVSAATIDIRALCLEQLRALGHRPFGIDLEGLSVEELTARLRALPAGRRHDLVFENVQARARTSLLMNSGFVIGTGDLSELALGWCTYNGDHMSMYNPNGGVPKTLVKFLVRWAAEHQFDGPVRDVLLDVVATEISPELLPTDADGRGVQATEEVVGPYELHDFFLYHLQRFGDAPDKVLYLAEHARFDRAYTPAELHRWLRGFLERFFASQFKRSCVPDGPKVGSISLSPRGDWRMPSDAQARVWLDRLASSEGSHRRAA